MQHQGLVLNARFVACADALCTNARRDELFVCDGAPHHQTGGASGGSSSVLIGFAALEKYAGSPFSALFPDAPFEVRSDDGPPLCAILVHQLNNHAILLKVVAVHKWL